MFKKKNEKTNEIHNEKAYEIRYVVVDKDITFIGAVATFVNSMEEIYKKYQKEEFPAEISDADMKRLFGL